MGGVFLMFYWHRVCFSYNYIHTTTYEIVREEIKMNDKVVLIFEDTKNLLKLKRSLIHNDYSVTLCEIETDKINKAIWRVKPDFLVFYYKQARPEIAGIAKSIQENTPLPIIIFSDESDTDLVSDTITMGASAFVVDGINTSRIKYIIEAARARFNKCQSLKNRLHKAESKFDSRSYTDRAKDILMRNKNMTEAEAYKLLKTMAENRNILIEELSKNLIEVSDLLAPAS